MSTFNGVIPEFPDICIDRFRPSPVRPPPLAGFLSHVHADHTDGLESWLSPFVYCSPATKEILLRLEKFPHRMNFAKGILESRKQTFRHLKKVLKPIPLERPTTLELAPEREIRVTLFDANHCVGAVMFLIEGDGKAILYTGDLRCEVWWVDKLMRSPFMFAYASMDGDAPLKTLDKVYIDTTFVVGGKVDSYRVFPSKMEGLIEMLQQVRRYPECTPFYFDSWTFGYEEVWEMLANHLDVQIHVDEYRYSLYRALANSVELVKAHEALTLVGYTCGNHYQRGYLTDHPKTRLHSCEQGTGCDIWDQGEQARTHLITPTHLITQTDNIRDFVRITPIITRHNGIELAELGAGCGKGDLDQRHELDVSDRANLEKLKSLCISKLSGNPQMVLAVLEKLQAIFEHPTTAIELDAAVLLGDDSSQHDGEMVDIDELPIEKLVPALECLVKKGQGANVQTKSKNDGALPKQIVSLPRVMLYAELRVDI